MRILPLLSGLIFGLSAFAQNTPVEIEQLKLFGVIYADGSSGLPEKAVAGKKGQYLVSTYQDPCGAIHMPVGTFLIGGTADKATTLQFQTESTDVSVPISQGMTTLDTVKRINEEIQKHGYELIPDHSTDSVDVFRFDMTKGTRPPVIRDEAELASFQKAVEFPGQVYAKFHACGWICRPASYTGEFASLGAELNKFIESGRSSLTYQEITVLLKSFNAPGKGFILPAINATPNYEFTRRDVTFYRQGARLSFKNWHFPGERRGIYIGTMRTGDPFDSGNRAPGHAVLTIDPEKKVLIWEKIYPQDIRSVVSDVVFDYKALP